MSVFLNGALNGAQYVFAEQFESTSRLMNSFLSSFDESSSFSPNAYLEIHPDCPRAVRRVYENTGVTQVRFQSLQNMITETMTPNYDHISVLGRSEDYLSYSRSENRRISLELAFLSSVNEGDRGWVDYAHRRSRWIQSLTMPTYDEDGLMYPPALIRLVLGHWINMRGVVAACSVTYEGPYVGQNSVFEYSHLIRMSMEIVSVNREPMSAADFLPVAGRRLMAPGT